MVLMEQLTPPPLPRHHPPPEEQRQRQPLREVLQIHPHLLMQQTTVNEEARNNPFKMNVCLSSWKIKYAQKKIALPKLGLIHCLIIVQVSTHFAYTILKKQLTVCIRMCVNLSLNVFHTNRQWWCLFAIINYLYYIVSIIIISHMMENREKKEA